jgi:hypothetical protein
VGGESEKVKKSHESEESNCFVECFRQVTIVSKILKVVMYAEHKRKAALGSLTNILTEDVQRISGASARTNSRFSFSKPKFRKLK